jgi:hypothetical protein
VIPKLSPRLRSICCGLLLAAAAFAAAGAAPTPATGRVLAPAASSLPDSELWAVQVRGSRAELRPARLARLRAHGVNTLVLVGRVTQARSSRAAAAARKVRLRLLVPVAGGGNAASACATAKRAFRTSSCALTAGSPAEARRLLATGAPDVVVVRVTGPSKVAALRNREYLDRVLALPGLRARAPFASRAWEGAIGLAARNASLDLGVAPTRLGGRGFTAYLRLLKRRHGRDLQRPSAPTGLATAAATSTSVTISWGRSRDNRAGVRYVVRRDGTRLAEVTGTRATLQGLGCGSSHDLGVTARDRAGNVSGESPALRATTASCGGGGGGPPPPPPPPPGFPPPPPPPPPRAGTVLPLGTSLNTAYRNAKPGETFLLAPGCWGGATIGHDPSKTASGAHIVFAAQDPSNRPVFGSCSSGSYQGNGIDLEGVKSLTLDGVVINGDLGIVPDGSTLAENVTVMRSKIKTTHVRAANGVIFQDTEFGNYRYDEPGGPSSSWISNYPGTPPSRNIQIERTIFHNIRQGNSSTHAECLILDNAEVVTIRQSTLKECPTMSLFLSGDNGGVARNVLIERNFFSCPAPNDTIGCGATINMRPDYQFQNILWRSNDIDGLVYLQGGAGGYSGVRFENNRVHQMGACLSSITYVNNTSAPGRQDCDPGSHSPPIGP